jgi:ABC-type antimicrobial peptide transport system permease subunit
MALALAGLGIGLALALAAGRVVASLLFEVAAADPAVYAAAVLLLAGSALLASWLPARRAARTDPLAVLREG